ncbi:MAG: carbon-nitrogen hydrolase family protein [bacterium]
MRIKVCAVQMSPSKDIESSVLKAADFLSMASKNKANIVCFPELFLLNWFLQDKSKEKIEENLKSAEDINGKTVSLFREQAKKFNAVIIIPFFEKYGDNYYNSSAVISEKGDIIGVYRKVHLPDVQYYYEKSYFSSGNEFPVFETAFGKIGIQMCWDNFYPESSRILALKGAEIIFAPTASAFNTNGKWSLAISANAFLNGVYIFRVNRVGRDKPLDFYGKSFCVAPDGVIMDDFAGINECALIYNIDTKEVENARKNWPFMENRSKDAYKDIINY